MSVPMSIAKSYDSHQAGPDLAFSEAPWFPRRKLGFHGRPCYRYAVQPKAFKSSENVNWEMLSIDEALLAFERIAEWTPLDSYLCTMQKCRKKRSLASAKLVHVHICSHGMDTHAVLESHLVSLFMECGCMPHAQHAFNRLHRRSEFTWTCLIQGYVECGESQRALNLVQEMREDDIYPSKFTFVALLKACARLQWIERGQDIHTELAEMGLETDLFIGSTLVDMYAKCGSLAKAQEVFDGLSVRSIVSWTALISGYAEHGPGEKALKCLEQMQLEGLSPDTAAYVCSLKACANIEDIDKGYGMHSEIAKKGFEGDSFAGNALVDMYSKCSSLAEAQSVFDNLPAQSVVSWTTLIAGYAEYGHSEEALNCLGQMQVEGERPNAVTLVCGLKACRDLGTLDRGREIHADIAREALERDLYVCNTLVDFYAKCGSMEEAWEVLNELPVRDVVSWTALITGYAERGLGEEALNCFQQMQMEGLSPDVASCNTVILGCAEQVQTEKALRIYAQMQERGLLPNSTTFLGVLKACKNMSALASGRKLHAQLLRSGGLKAVEVQLATVLLDMYAKSGSMNDAQQVFDAMPVRDSVAWTALTTGYAGQGESDFVFELFKRMEEEGMQLDGDTFLSVLIACTHAGLVDEGQIFFEAMRKQFGIAPTIEHHNCMIDLLGRAGRLNEALTILKESPVPPDHVMWGTVLGACRKWRNVELARHAFECAVTLNKNYGAAYILMANIFADAQLWEEMKMIEAMKVKMQAYEQPGSHSVMHV